MLLARLGAMERTNNPLTGRESEIAALVAGDSSLTGAQPPSSIGR
jgi:hypothetical protein